TQTCVEFFKPLDCKYRIIIESKPPAKLVDLSLGFHAFSTVKIAADFILLGQFGVKFQVLANLVVKRLEIQIALGVGRIKLGDEIVIIIVNISADGCQGCAGGIVRHDGFQFGNGVEGFGVELLILQVLDCVDLRIQIQAKCGCKSATAGVNDTAWFSKSAGLCQSLFCFAIAALLH